jgi:hypothetical protein
MDKLAINVHGDRMVVGNSYSAEVVWSDPDTQKEAEAALHRISAAAKLAVEIAESWNGYSGKLTDEHVFRLGLLLGWSHR